MRFLRILFIAESLYVKCYLEKIIEGKHKPIVSKEDFLIINSESHSQVKEYKTDNDQLPLKQFVYCEACNTPLTGFLVKQKGIVLL